MGAKVNKVKEGLGRLVRAVGQAVGSFGIQWGPRPGRAAATTGPTGKRYTTLLGTRKTRARLGRAVIESRLPIP